MYSYVFSIVQLNATILAAFVQVGVKEWMFTSIKDICSPDQKSHLTCPHNQVFFTASVIWLVLRLLALCPPADDMLQGSHRTKSSIRDRVHLPPATLCHYHWRVPASSILALAEAASRFLGEIHQHASHSQWRFFHPSCSRHQLLELVRDGLHLPICHQATELWVVE